MTRSDKHSAIQMRKSGITITEIARITGAAKSTVSIWTRDVILPEGYGDKIRMIKSNNCKQMNRKMNSDPYFIKRRLIGNIKKQHRAITTIHGMDYFSCPRCRQTRKISDFNCHKSRKVSVWCKECVADWYSSLRKYAIEVLGGSCNCGCDVIELLEIHHLNFNGNEERKVVSTSAILKKIISMSPEIAHKEYRVLCKVCHSVEHVKSKYPSAEKYDIQWVNGT